MSHDVLQTALIMQKVRYTCTLHTGTHLTTTGEPDSTVKRIPLDVSRLKARYIKALSNDHTDWPLHYVRLALVKSDPVLRGNRNMEEIKSLVLQGQLDELLLRREPLDDLSDIFHYENKPSPRLILIMGGPGEYNINISSSDVVDIYCAGIGKTTLAHHICVKWAKDRFLSEDFDAVILISLGSVQQKSFEKVIMEHIGEENYPQMQKTAGARCLLILEGLDELPVDRRLGDPFLIRLIKEWTVLEKAIIVITARPQICEEIVPGRCIEVMGFGKDQIKEFVETSFHKEPQCIEIFLQQLDEYPQLYSLCYVPMYLVMLVEIFHYNEKKLPSTLTNVYQLFIVMTLQKQVEKYFSKNPACSTVAIKAAAAAAAAASVRAVVDSVEKTALHAMFKDIPGKTRGIVVCLCKLAYRGFFDWYCYKEGVRNSDWEEWKDPKIVFTQSDLQECGIEVKSDFDGFGLLKVMRIRLLRDINTYRFIHLSIQEFLCAVYISLQSQTEQLRLLREHFDDYPDVFTFVCGLTGLASGEMFQFLFSKLLELDPSFSESGGYCDDSCLHQISITVRCLNESISINELLQCSDPCHSVSPFGLMVFCCNILPYDCLCYSKIMSCYPVSSLYLTCGSIDNKRAEMLVKHYPNTNTTGQPLEKIMLMFMDLTIEATVNLMKTVKESELHYSC